MYAPPELMSGRPFTVQGDVYALGILLYQCVIGDLDRPLAGGWDPSERLGRHQQPVADAGGVEHHLSRAADQHPALDRGDHASASLAGTPFEWQIATARASAAWSASGGSGNDSSAATIRWTCSLGAPPCPHTACLTCWGV